MAGTVADVAIPLVAGIGGGIAVARGQAAKKAAQEVAASEAEAAAEATARTPAQIEAEGYGIAAERPTAPAPPASERTPLPSAAPKTAAEAAELTPYGGPGGGHHVPAKSAFEGAPGYDPNAALAIPNAEMTRLGVQHLKLVTPAQQRLYTAFAKTGETLTWEAMETIETEALIAGGMEAGMARATVQRAIQTLKDAGVAGPTRIPWSAR